MPHKIYWLKYLSPIVGVIFCPVTILFLWSIWSGPVITSDTDINEEVTP